MSLVELVVLALATWRLGRLVQFERGPGAIFIRLRELAGVEHDEDGKPTSYPDTELGILARCLDCGSVWIGVGLAGLYLLAPGPALVVALPLALSGAAVGLEVMVDGTRQH